MYVVYVCRKLLRMYVNVSNAGAALSMEHWAIVCVCNRGPGMPVELVVAVALKASTRFQIPADISAGTAVG